MIVASSSNYACWRLWWRWSYMSALGAVAAALLYALVPTAITHPDVMFDDWNYYVATPWRYLVIYSAIYGAVSIAQWSMLRRYVPDAWQWVVVTTGSAALLFPTIMWLFNTVGLGGLAALTWSAGIDYPFGLGGHVLTLIGQWFVLRQWTRHAWLWFVTGAFLATTAVVGLLLLPERLSPTIRLHSYPLSIFRWGTLNYALMGVILVGLLAQNGRSVRTAPRVSSGSQSIH